MTGLRGSRSTQQTTDSRSLLVGAAEQIQAADYVKCAGLTGYNPAIATTVAPVNADGTNTSSVSVTVVSIDYWSSDSAGVQGFSGACIASSYDNNPAAASRMQRITLRATSDENLTIVKRAP